MSESAVPRRIAAAAAGIAAALCGGLFVLHLRMIVSPAPQEMREGAMLWITRLFLEGRNPYDLSELPASANAYGILYHLIVLPFARIFGNTYAVHRAVSAVAIAGSCAVLYRLLRRERTGPLLSAVGIMLFYASSIYFVAPLARPDAVAVFFSMASMAVLFDDRVTRRDALKGVPYEGPADQKGVPYVRFACGLLLALLALFTKLYLAFPPFVLALYLVVFGPRTRGLAYGAIAILASALALWTATLKYPAYITMSIVDNMNSSMYYDVEHMWRQTLDWLAYSLPLTVGLAALLVSFLRNPNLRRRFRSRPSLFAFASVVNSLVFVFVFGGHPGAHMTYLFHLVTPVLTVAVFPRLEADSRNHMLAAAALAVALVANLQYFPLTFGRFRDAEATFVKLSEQIQAHANVLGSTEVAGPLAQAGRPVVDSGHSQYFGNAAVDCPCPGLVPADALRTRWSDFLSQIDSGIVDHRFDLIIRNRRPGLIPSDLVSAHYVRLATIDLDFPWGAQRWPVDLWVPRP